MSFLLVDTACTHNIPIRPTTGCGSLKKGGSGGGPPVVISGPFVCGSLAMQWVASSTVPVKSTVGRGLYLLVECNA